MESEPCEPGGLDSRRRAGAFQQLEPVRSLFHDQARRLGHRPGAEPPDRRGAWREPDASERGPRTRLRSPLDTADLVNTANFFQSYPNLFWAIETFFEPNPSGQRTSKC